MIIGCVFIIFKIDENKYKFMCIKLLDSPTTYKINC